jgi:DNA-binding GntR family transcriptional regulator
MLEAVMAGDAERAEAMARQHVTQAAAFMIERLRSEAPEQAGRELTVGR